MPVEYGDPDELELGRRFSTEQEQDKITYRGLSFTHIPFGRV